MMRKKWICTTLLFSSVFAAAGQEEGEESFWDQFAKPELHGFWEFRGGYRLQNDPYEKDMSVMESRLPLASGKEREYRSYRGLLVLPPHLITVGATAEEILAAAQPRFRVGGSKSGQRAMR